MKSFDYMLIIGAKGFAIQLLDVINQNNNYYDISFYDDQSINLPNKLFDSYQIYKNLSDAEHYFKTVDYRFTLGISSPKIREKFFILMKQIGGQPETIISPKATLGTIQVNLGECTTILSGAVIESTVELGVGTLVNLNTTLTHGLKAGNYCVFSPGVHISGNCNIGSHCFFGTGSIVLPKINIGNNVTVGAGAVVIKNLQDNETVVGIPSRPINIKHS